MSIRIFYDCTKYKFSGWKKAEKTIEEVIRNESKVSGEINIIITNDEIIREMNRQFLRHNYNTDVIAFNYNEGSYINGEIYISIDTVKRNSSEYKVYLKEEVLRVIIHGILHLLGFNDTEKSEREKMKKMEDFWLQKFEK